MKNKAYAKFGGANKLYYGRYANGEWMCNIWLQAPTLAKKCETTLAALWCGQTNGCTVTYKNFLDW